MLYTCIYYIEKGGRAMVKEDFARHLCRKINKVFYGDEGMAGVPLVSYVLLFIAIETIGMFMVVIIPEVHAKLWVMLNNDLFK